MAYSTISQLGYMFLAEGSGGYSAGIYHTVWAYQRVFHGPVLNPGNKVFRDISRREIAAIAPLLVGIVFLGVYSGPFLDRVTPSVNHLLAHVQAAAAPNAHVPPTGVAPVRYSVPAVQEVDNPPHTAAPTGFETGLARRHP